MAYIDNIDRISILKSYCLEYGVNEFTDPVLNNPDFAIWSGSAQPIHHHYGDGGLLKHVYEVFEYSQNITRIHNCSNVGAIRVNFRELIVSIIWHDYGKLWDYVKINGVWGGTSHKRSIHHISRSALEWEKHCDKLYSENPDNTFQVDMMSVTHNILAHHGRREWGSPVAPESREAWVLHLADNLSARLDDCDKHDILKH